MAENKEATIMSNNKKQLPAFLVLTIICLVAALALAATNAVTAGPIEEHKAAARAANFSAVLSATAYEEVKLEGADKSVVLVEAWSKGNIVDALSGATVTSEAVIEAVNAAVEAEDLTASAKGFQSDVVVSVTLDEAGAVASLTIDSASETPNFGTRCAQDEGFISQFVGKTAPFVRQEGKVGYCVSASAEGYGGAVAVTLGVNLEGEIVGAKIGDNNFRETGTIGGKWLAEDKLEQFIGVDLVNGGALDTIAGATVTSDAVKAAANKGADALRAYLGIESDTPVFGEPKPIEYADSVAAGDYSVSAAGFQSDVKVNFTVDENSTITALTMDTSGETQGYGTRCGEDANFVNQFIGKTVPVMEFDVLSGATITSNTVVKAINSIAVAGAEQPSVEASAPAGDAKTASAKGLLSDVKVTITLNADGTIATMVVDASGETEAIAKPCTEEAFLSQFIGKKGPFENADVVAGATYTSNAVINAVNSLFAAEEAAPAGDAKTASAKGLLSDVKVTITLNADGTIATMVVDASGETEAIAKPCTEEAFLSQFIGKKGPFENADVVAGATYTSNAVINAVNSLFAAEEAAPAGDAKTASAKGLLSDVKVTITLNADGTIATMVVDASGETEAIAKPCTEDAFLSQFIGKKGPFENADVVAGATYTSNAVINAVNSLFAAEEAAPAGDAKTASAKGLLSDVKVTITLNADGTIATMVVDASGETEAIAKPCTEEAFLSQFIGKKGPFENADVVAGATYTSNAVINAVNSLFAAEEAAPAGDAKTASAKGLLSDVKVTITLNADGTIATMVVDASGETEAIAKPCTEDAFLSQFIGKKGPFENADVVAGATYTSNAVINAVNSLFAAEEAAPAGDAKTASAKGLLSDVKVTITLNADGTIATMVVDASGETEAIAKPCTEEAFLSQFIGKKGPFENAEVVSGATYTSNAVINAVNSLFAAEEAAPAGDAKTASAKGLLSDVKVTITLNADGTIATMVVDASGETEAIAKPCTEEAFLSQFIGKKGPFENAEVVSGATYTSNAVINAVNSLFAAEEAAPAGDAKTASAKGLLSDVKVTITLNADGTIATMVVDASGETEAIAKPCTEEAFLSQFIGKKGPFENADVVAGATYTSNAVINAVNSLFGK
ncbi:MAG: FMN-binding protein [Clostridiales bacterium]|nr:FMN-binding protein [Clostridiales bacterium]